MKTLIVDYIPVVLEKLIGKNVIVRFKSMESFLNNKNDCLRFEHVHGFFIDLPLALLSQIEFDKSWMNAPIFLRIDSIGNVIDILYKRDLISKLQLHIYLSSQNHSNYSNLKILSSLGIDCGLWINSTDKVEDEMFLDLASYFFMSTAPHASIEPFDYIARHLKDEKNLSIDSVYMRNDQEFLFVDDNLDLHSLNNGNKICNLSEFDDSKEFDSDSCFKMSTYYTHFMNLDKCSKCKSFRLCSGSLYENLHDCESVMAEILEYALLHDKLNANK